MAEALQLADALTRPTYPDWVMHIPALWHPPAQAVREAAAELRRQHGEIKSMRAERLRSERRLLDVKAQRDALLEALKYHQEQTRPIQGTLDVIKAVEGKKNHG